MLMPVTHLLDNVDTLSTISPMKNKISPEKIKLHKQVAEDPRRTTSLSEESDSVHELSSHQINFYIYAKPSPYTHE